jgi:hypothetical protein
MEDPIVLAALQAFLLDYVQSYEQVAVLILIAAGMERAWSAQDVGTHIGMPVAFIEAAPRSVAQHSPLEALEELAQHGLLEVIEGPPRQFIVAKEEARDLIRALADLYATDPLAIMDMMNANAIVRMRNDAVRAFSSAFVVGKKKDG